MSGAAMLDITPASAIEASRGANVAKVCKQANDLVSRVIHWAAGRTFLGLRALLFSMALLGNNLSTSGQPQYLC